MKTLVIIPTLNERGTIIRLIDGINELGIQNLEILVVDDDSPDGTWRLVEEKRVSAENLLLLRRFASRGRGSAVRDGLMAALERGADFTVEMDGDLSHSPGDIPRMLEAARTSEVVIGSRFISGGKLERKSPLRNLITKCAHKYLRVLFGYRLKDPTSGFRCFTGKSLASISPATLSADGPFGVTEILWRCHAKGLVISEVPVTFRDRAGGSSKLRSAELLKYLASALGLRFRRF